MNQVKKFLNEREKKKTHEWEKRSEKMYIKCYKQ